jgi:hypothetical protein
MKLSSILVLMLVSIFMLFTVNGCIFNSPSDIDEKADENETLLDKDLGGYTTTDEPEAFGDQTLAKENPDDESVTDLIETDPTITQQLNRPEVPVYFLRLAWGLLKGDSTATLAVEWNGKAEINKGLLLILKKVRFEGNDRLLLPRKSKQIVEWKTFTEPHYDGVVLAILNNDTTDTPGTFTLKVGEYSRTFKYDELDSLNLVEPVGTNGHEVSIVSRKKVVTPFAGGFMEGRWMRKDSLGGVFDGKWINSLGTRVGFMKGIWGVNKLGQNVMFGKWIDLSGKFQGLLSGSWGNSATPEKGWLKGVWVNKSLTASGHYDGKWQASQKKKNAGFFDGAWRRK